MVIVSSVLLLTNLPIVLLSSSGELDVFEFPVGFSKLKEYEMLSLSSTKSTVVQEVKASAITNKSNNFLIV